MLIRPARREYRTWSLDSRRWALYTPRFDDIVIATAPKCGTTWTQQIVSSLIFQDAIARAISTVSPWIDARFRGSSEQLFDRLEAQTHRRFIKTHLPLDGLPFYDRVRYIHVARDGRDACMSYHHHLTGMSRAAIETFDQIGLDDPAVGRPYPKIPASAAEFFRLWISTPAVPGHTEGTPNPSFFDLVAGYWAERRRPNVLLVHYNNLKTDLDGEMRRIAAFLDIAIDEAIWPSLVAAAGFESMRAAGSELMPQSTSLFPGGAGHFFNKGTNGRWRDVLAPDDLELYEAKVRDRFCPALARWIADGQLD